MNKVQALLFDLDNTLMDRDSTFRSFSEQFVSDFLGHLQPEEARRVVEDIIVRDADGYRDKDGFCRAQRGAAVGEGSVGCGHPGLL